MKTKRRSEIIIELDEVVIRRPQATAAAWCEQCGDQARMVTADAAAAAARVSSRAIYREVEAGRLHFIELDDRSVLICVNSLYNLPG